MKRLKTFIGSFSFGLVKEMWNPVTRRVFFYVLMTTAWAFAAGASISLDAPRWVTVFYVIATLFWAGSTALQADIEVMKAETKLRHEHTKFLTSIYVDPSEEIIHRYEQEFSEPPDERP